MLTQDGLRSISAEGAQRATGEETGCPGPKAVRFSAQKKTEVVLRLLRGEALDLVSRALQVPALRLAAVCARQLVTVIASPAMPPKIGSIAFQV